MRNRIVTCVGFLTFATLAPVATAAAATIGVLQVASGSATFSSAGMQLVSSPAAVSTGIFAGLNGTTIGLADVTFGAGGAFATFAASPTMSVSASAVPGAFDSSECFSPAAAGRMCTPPIGDSPHNLFNTDTGSVAAISLDVTVQDGAVTQTGTAILTMQFTESYQQVLTTIFSGGQVRASYSAELAAGTAGTLFFGGGVNLSATGLDFPASPVVIGGLAGGNFLVNPLSTGTFAALANSFGTALDLPAAPLLNFLSFQADPGLQFDLSNVEGGGFSPVFCAAPPALGQSCTLTDQPFELANVSGGSVLSFNVDGMMSAGIEQTVYQAVYSMQFLGLTYQQVLATLLGGGSVTTIYSATFSGDGTASVPEPVSLVLVGVGLGVGVFRRWARVRA